MLRQLSLQEGIEETYRVGCCSRSGDGLHCVEIIHHIVKIVHHIVHGWSRRVDCCISHRIIGGIHSIGIIVVWISIVHCSGGHVSCHCGGSRVPSCCCWICGFRCIVLKCK